MSRTDKDTPYFVELARTKNRREVHAWSCDGDNCDIEMSLIPWHLRPYTTHAYTYGCGTYEHRRPVRPGCTYEFTRGHYFDSWAYMYGRGPTREERRMYWYSRARGEERERLGEAIKDYRANGEIDHVEFDHTQHRHGVTWYLW